MSEALDYMAKRAAGEPFYLAHPLAEFAKSERLDDAALAARLGCPPENLTRLRLCRAPRPDPQHFRADVLREQAPAAGAADPGVLLAARDPDPPPEPPR